MDNKNESYFNVERRKEIRDTARKLRKQFLKYQEAEIVYSMSHVLDTLLAKYVSLASTEVPAE